ncbi:MAG: DUF481 domain-containing protein, partial [Candidatus Hydrogenedentes bacterium]|nr:DUF481 domain-containing protein [Candidatus Hydrogenedentota bacterium]
RTAMRDSIRGAAYDDMYTALLDIGNGVVNTPRDVLDLLHGILGDLRDPLRDYTSSTEGYVNLRLGVSYSQQIFRATTLSEEFVLMPNLNEIGEFRAVSELALTTPLSDALSLSTSLKTEYDSMADERGVERWDNTLMTQLSYRF